ncbi:thioredoxin [Secundilactobacillus oryzae JCM 18671]|uniref:Thioredoxin n=1 Tax=Secundilactobacillus oryzae JCM 18671 TaxID=1291743 RepID=A0A081BHX5_9LACO|nr:thioredoxin [Secundilactobacillus oryzae]GAK47643.1 thioredoxin [Secundilactobacillus oryzae JCM 18671]
MAVELTKDNFIEQTADGVTVVDFWADWCGPCKIMDPVLDQLESQFGQKIKFAKLDVDGNQDLAMSYKVMSVPSLVFFRDGKALEKVSGVYPKEKLAAYLERKLAE